MFNINNGYTIIEEFIFNEVKKYFEALPSGSDDYGNGFFDVVAQYGGGGQPYLIIGGEYDSLCKSEILTAIEKLSSEDLISLKEFYENDFLEDYFDEKAGKYFYSDDDLAQELFGRFKCWIDDNFNLDEMLYEKEEQEDDDENDSDEEENECIVEDRGFTSLTPIYCIPIVSNCNPDIRQFLNNGLTQFREEVFLFIEKNKDDGILSYSNEQTFAALFVNGLVRRDTYGEITALQEYATSFTESVTNGRPDIFLRVQDMAIWIECKLDKSFRIEPNHWEIPDWLKWDEQAILKQVEKYYYAERELINDSFTGGHYVMTMVFKLIKEKPMDFLNLAKSNLLLKSKDECDRPWFYSAFFLDSDNTNSQNGIEIYGTIKIMK